jgi:hypothetical protein
MWEGLTINPQSLIVFDKQHKQSIARLGPPKIGSYPDKRKRESNAVFIAHARADIPALLDELEKKEQRIADLEVALEQVRLWIKRCEYDQAANLCHGVLPKDGINE